MAGFNSRQGFGVILQRSLSESRKPERARRSAPRPYPDPPGDLQQRPGTPTPKAIPMHPRTLHRLHQRLATPHRLARLIRDFLDSEPDHTHALVILNNLTAIRTFIAASVVTMGLAHGGSIGMERMAREVDSACRAGHARGLRGVGSVVRRAMSRDGK